MGSSGAFPLHPITRGKRGWVVGKTGFWGQTRLGLNLGAAVHWPGDLSEPTCPHLQNVASNPPTLQDCGESQMQECM